MREKTDQLIARLRPLSELEVIATVKEAVIAIKDETECSEISALCSALARLHHIHSVENEFKAFFERNELDFPEKIVQRYINSIRVRPLSMYEFHQMLTAIVEHIRS
jgi:hypothetical protein